MATEHSEASHDHHDNDGDKHDHDGDKHDDHAGDEHDGKEHEGKGHEHGGLPAEVVAFHDVMSPLWHADPGEKRQGDTCSAMPSFVSASTNVASSKSPEGVDAAGYQAGVEGLVAAVTDLETTCGNPERVGMFDSSFTDVHDAFHALMKASKPPAK